MCGPLDPLWVRIEAESNDTISGSTADAVDAIHGAVARFRRKARRTKRSRKDADTYLTAVAIVKEEALSYYHGLDPLSPRARVRAGGKDDAIKTIILHHVMRQKRLPPRRPGR